MTQTFRQRSALAQVAERGLRREQPFKFGRIVLMVALLVVLWGVMG